MLQLVAQDSGIVAAPTTNVSNNMIKADDHKSRQPLRWKISAAVSAWRVVTVSMVTTRPASADRSPSSWSSFCASSE